MNPADHQSDSFNRSDTDSATSSISDMRLEQAIARYTTALTVIEQQPTTPELEQILDVLMARDAIEKLRLSVDNLPSQWLTTLIHLDSRLKTQTDKLVANPDLAECRASMQPPESAWWWFLESEPPQDSWWTGFDWLWNLLTVACLVFTGTFVTNTAQAFSSNGFDLLGTFSTITQGAGLVLVTGGALTEQGQQMIEQIWSSLNIPRRFHAEATFLVAVLLLFTAYTINQNLPAFGRYYYQQAEEAEVNGEWLAAKDNYQRALQFIPSETTIQLRIGKINEQLGQLEAAQKNYQNALLETNDNEAIIRFAHVNLLQALQAVRWTEKIGTDQEEYIHNAEIYLDLAERNLTEANQDNYFGNNPYLEIKTQRLLKEVYINQGILLWAKIGLENPDQLAKDEGLDQAEALFQKAADLEYYLPTVAIGRRADCYLKIAHYINSKLKTKRHQGLTENLQAAKQEAIACSFLISKNPSHDLYDVLLMSRALEAKLGI